MKIRIWLGLIAVGSLMCRELQADEKEIRSFYQEYPAAFARLKAAYSRFEAEGVTRNSLRADMETTLRLQFDGERKKVTLTRRRPGVAGVEGFLNESVMVVSPEAVFELARTPESGSRFTVRGIDSLEGEELNSSRPISSNFHLTAGRLAQAPFAIDNFSVGDLTDAAKFRIDSCERVTSDGVTIVRVRFSPAKDSKSTVAGSVELLPDRLWASRRYELERRVTVPGRPKLANPRGLDRTATVDYEADQAGIPVPRRVVQSTQGMTSTSDFTRFTLGATTPEREFTLANYNAPDVTRPPVDPTRSTLTYWPIATAVAALCGALLLLRGSRNGRSQPRTESH